MSKNLFSELFFIFLIIAYFSVQNTFCLKIKKGQPLIDSNNITVSVEKKERDSIVVEDFFKRVRHDIDVLYKENNWNEDNLQIENISKMFKNSTYYAIANIYANNKYLQNYYNFFLDDNNKMSKKSFSRFYALNFLEGELLVEEIHPTLTVIVPNIHNIKNKKGDETAIEYWKVILKLVDYIYIRNSFNDGMMLNIDGLSFVLEKTNLYQNYTNIGKKNSQFFQNLNNKLFNFFDEGDKKMMSKADFKILFSYFYFIEKETLSGL